MNTKTNTIIAPSLELLPQDDIDAGLRRAVDRASRYALGFVKFSTASAPLLCLALMLLALWGVIGKATYVDLDVVSKDSGSEVGEASNYPVNDTKALAPCGRDENNSIETEKVIAMPAKIDWEHVV